MKELKNLVLASSLLLPSTLPIVLYAEPVAQEVQQFQTDSLLTELKDSLNEFKTRLSFMPPLSDESRNIYRRNQIETLNKALNVISEYNGHELSSGQKNSLQSSINGFFETKFYTEVPVSNTDRRGFLENWRNYTNILESALGRKGVF